MKAFAMAAVLAFGAAGAAFAADPVEGIWKTQEDEGAYAHVTFAPCGAKICGTIARTWRGGAEFASPTIGRQLVWDMESKGDGSYSGGRIWQPSSDKVYRSKMALEGDTLRVSGCVGPICKKQVWSRVK